MRTLRIDPGHGGENMGTTAGGLVEKDIALLVCQNLSVLLSEAGLPHELLRDSDATLSQWARGLGSTRDSLTISLHVNSLQSRPDVHGAECFIWPGYYLGPKGVYLEGEGNPLARRVAQTILDNLPPDLHSRGVIVAKRDLDGDGDTRDDRWIENPRAILAAHAGPVVLFEAGYASNPENAAFLKTPRGRMGLALAMFEASKEWLLC